MHGLDSKTGQLLICPLLFAYVKGFYQLELRCLW